MTIRYLKGFDALPDRNAPEAQAPIRALVDAEFQATVDGSFTIEEVYLYDDKGTRIAEMKKEKWDLDFIRDTFRRMRKRNNKRKQQRRARTGRK